MELYMEGINSRNAYSNVNFDSRDFERRIYIYSFILDILFGDSLFLHSFIFTNAT